MICLFDVGWCVCLLVVVYIVLVYLIATGVVCCLWYCLWYCCL